MRLRKPLVLLLITAALLISLVPSSAQSETPLRLAVPAFLESLIEADLVEQYEAAHPGVTLEIVSAPNDVFYSAGEDVEAYLDRIESYVGVADVVAITSNQIAPEATRAGYFLNLAPLISTDPAFDEADFLPGMLESFQWDNGQWALPVSADVIVMIYDPEAFDAAGQPYPSAQWTLDDLEAAIRALTQYDDEGNVSSPAMLELGNLSQLMHSLLGGGPMFDLASQPTLPRFDNPQLAQMLDQWQTIRDDGLLTLSLTSIDFNEIPMFIGQSLIATSGQFTGGDGLQITLLPGGRAGLLVNGVAVSAGTQYPDAAYELAKYITTNADLATASFGITPARRSLIGAEADNPLGFLLNVPDELRPAIDEALNNAISGEDALFTRFIDVALQTMSNTGVDAQSALQEVEQEAIERLQSAEARRETAVLGVATPVPPIMGAGEVVIEFGYMSLSPQLPNRDQWDQLIADFVASDPEVGQVNLDVKIPFPNVSLEGMAEDYDCFYMPNNLVPGADLSHLRSMDPLLSSDLSFSPNDIVGNLLDQVRRDNQIWAMPITVQPLVLWYSPQVFQQSGAQAPFEGWSVSDFENALRTLKINPDDDAPFVSRNGDGSHLLVLIAAYGGLPLDYRTDPVTINFTDPATVDAIRQVLDLAKNGYIEYMPLASQGTAVSFGTPEDVAMYSQLLSNLAFLLGGESDDADAYQLATFPQGTQYSAVSYDLGAAYISANTPAIEPCYRFISAIANTPDLFSQGMPVRRSQLTSPELVTSQGQEASDFYSAMDRLMQQPNTIPIPSTFQAATDLNSIGDLLITIWLNRAFDRYVLEDADLQIELEDAQTFASAYQGCAAVIPPSTSEDNIINYLRQYLDCAVQIDPSLAPLFGGLAG